jgi:hypothetical protein
MRVLLTFVTAAAVADGACAEDWSNTITPYLWGTSVRGTMALGTPLGPTKSIQVLGGYKYLREDYENGTGTNYFRYDIALQGPALGVAFKF